MESDERNLFVVVSARALARRLDNIKLRIISLVHDDKNGTKLQVAGADQLVMPEKGSGIQIQTSMMNPTLADSLLARTSFKRTAGYALQERVDDPVASWKGETVAQLSVRKGFVILAVWQDGEFLYSPPADTVLSESDKLIIFAESDDVDIFGKIKVNSG